MQADICRRQPSRWLGPSLCACLLLLQLPGAEGAQAKRTGDPQMREAVRQAFRLAHPNANVDQLALSERQDLADEFSRIAEKAARPVRFYSVSDIDSSSDDGSLWVVLSGDSALGSDELYSFESSDDAEQSAQKFDRLMSHLGVSIRAEMTTSLARFFLECCVRAVPAETITREEELHHSIERFYIQIYGDVWRGLQAGSEWSEGYKKAAVQLTPTSFVQGNAWRVTVARLVLSFGMHPQLQEWDIAVSPNGAVRVLAVQSIFPKEDRWLSYAFRSDVDPRLH